MDITEKQMYDYIFPLRRGGISNEELIPYIEQFSEFFCGAISIPKVREMVEKAGEVYDRESGNINLAQEVYDYVKSTSGVFTSTEIDINLKLSTKADKGNRSKIIRRLIDRGEVERVGNKNGQFRFVEDCSEDIEWEKDQGKPLDIIMPLGLDRLVNVYPGNIIVVAGMSNAGKTALLLNIVGLNLDRFKKKLYYFSSEMGPCELKTRIDKFSLPYEAWRGCRFKENVDNFEDSIKPDCINIIDYMEILDEAYAIGKKLKRIHDKLNEGIAIIAIQKDKYKELGVGSSYSLQKPRLYLTMNEDKNIVRIKIIKAKNWKTDFNPNGLIKDVEIIDGYQFKELHNWKRYQEEENGTKSYKY